jgi:uncharacterized repeat protein (TIGR04138 family)
MSIVHTSPTRRTGFDREAYQFVLAALQFTQERLGRSLKDRMRESETHISGQELCEGIREFASGHFGLMALAVFQQWGIHSTADFGRIVFEMIERGEMRKTPHDHVSDFFDVYDFETAFDRDYRLDVGRAFTHA